MNQFYPDEMNPSIAQTVPAKERDEFTTPSEEYFDSESMRGSMQKILSDNIGQFVIVEFLIGTQSMTRKEGILYSVGRNYLTLYEEQSQTFIVCDFFSIKFVTFYLPGKRPPTTPTQPPAPQPRSTRPVMGR